MGKEPVGLLLLCTYVCVVSCGESDVLSPFSSLESATLRVLSGEVGMRFYSTDRHPADYVA